MEYYRIGEFCKEFGISPETLKFYDRNGILKPAWKDESSYRYYGGYQSVHLAEYYFLSQIGFTLNESKELLQTGSLEEFINQFEKKHFALEEELRQRQAVFSKLGEKLENLRRVSQGESWYLEPMPEGYFCVPIRKKEGYTWWKDGGLPEIWQRVELKIPPDFDFQLKDVQHVWGCMISAQSMTHNSENYRLEQIPKGRCFLYYHSIPVDYDEEGKLSSKVWDFQAPLSVMKQHNLRPRGDFYQQRLCVTHEAEGAFVQVVTRIPVE
jgi:DNA-binding transcriptional MerR regulator